MQKDKTATYIRILDVGEAIQPGDFVVRDRPDSEMRLDCEWVPTAGSALSPVVRPEDANRYVRVIE